MKRSTGCNGNSIQIPLTNYIDQCRDHLIQRTIHAAKHNSLEAVIITEKEEKPKPMMLRLHPADRMSDVRLRQLVEEVMRCEDPEGQVQLIRDNFFSLHDYLDLLDSNCLYGDEYQALYKTFDDMELAIFAKIIFYEELRSDPWISKGLYPEERDRLQLESALSPVPANLEQRPDHLHRKLYLRHRL